MGVSEEGTAACLLEHPAPGFNRELDDQATTSRKMGRTARQAIGKSPRQAAERRRVRSAYRNASTNWQSCRYWRRLLDTGDALFFHHAFITLSRRVSRTREEKLRVNAKTAPVASSAGLLTLWLVSGLGQRLANPRDKWEPRHLKLQHRFFCCRTGIPGRTHTSASARAMSRSPAAGPGETSFKPT